MQDGGISRRRPSDGVVFADCPIATDEIVDDAVSAARTALKDSNWGDVRPRDRTRALRRWADLIEEWAGSGSLCEKMAA